MKSNLGSSSGIVSQVAEATTQSRLSKSIRTIVLWATFDVLVGSGTILWSLLTSFGSAKPIHLFDLLANGELFIISVSITASAVGMLIRSGKMQETRVIVSLCAAFAILFVGILAFASLGAGGRASNIDGYGMFSLIWYIVSIIVGLQCILIAEV
jgi:hypothetical protein